MRRTKQFPEAETRIAPWGDHPAEFRWKPSRRKLEDHEFEERVGPKTMHSGLLAHVSEPDLLSKRPPFIDKGPLGKTQPLYDGEMERCRAKVAERRLSKAQRAAIAEERWERSQVLDLESWERSHVQPPRSRSMSKLSLGSPQLSTSISNATMLGGAMPSASDAAMLGGVSPAAPACPRGASCPWPPWGSCAASHPSPGTTASVTLGGSVLSAAMNRSGALPDVMASRSMPRRVQSESALQLSTKWPHHIADACESDSLRGYVR